MIRLNPADCERITRPKKGRPYSYKCRYCGAPATWKETFKSRDREGRRNTRGVCEKCYQAAKAGRHDGRVRRQRREE